MDATFEASLDAARAGESVAACFSFCTSSRRRADLDLLSCADDIEDVSDKEMSDLRLRLFFSTVSKRSCSVSFLNEALKHRGSSSSTSLMLSELRLPRLVRLLANEACSMSASFFLSLMVSMELFRLSRLLASPSCPYLSSWSVLSLDCFGFLRFLSTTGLYCGDSEPQNKYMKFWAKPRLKKLMPRYLPVTCSLVVRPLLTRIIWNIKRPPMGNRSTPISTSRLIEAIAGGVCIGVFKTTIKEQPMRTSMCRQRNAKNWKKKR